MKHGVCQIWKREQKIGVSGFVHRSSTSIAKTLYKQRSRHSQNFVQAQEQALPKYCSNTGDRSWKNFVQTQEKALPKPFTISENECVREALTSKFPAENMSLIISYHGP